MNRCLETSGTGCWPKDVVAIKVDMKGAWTPVYWYGVPRPKE